MPPAAEIYRDTLIPQPPGADTSRPVSVPPALEGDIDWAPILAAAVLLGALYYMHVNDWEGINDAGRSITGAGLRLVGGTESPWEKTLGNSGEFHPFAQAS